MLLIDRFVYNDSQDKIQFTGLQNMAQYHESGRTTQFLSTSQNLGKINE